MAQLHSRREKYEASDGVDLFYDDHEVLGSGDGGGSLVFLHGWSGSGRYWSPALDAFVAQPCAHVSRIYVIDIRGHGDSAFTGDGCTVARLAEDLRDFISARKPPRPLCVCGSSMGAAILWSHCEQYGNDGVDGAVFVDQAPLQYEKEDWKLGSKGLRGPSDLAGLQRALNEDMKAFAAGNAEACLVDPKSVDKDITEMLTRETLRCSPTFLGGLMADHTQIDWRGVIRERLKIPILNFAGGMSGVFPAEGVAKVCSTRPLTAITSHPPASRF